MRNQTSFRLTTTLLPSDTTAKTTTVINKLDAGGNKFYPTFTEETVVLTNDDRTIMETTKATCTNGVLTFVKRWLSDDLDPSTWNEYEIENRKLTWNPWSIAFITAWASDILDKDDDIVWSGNQTFTGSATYQWALITRKWVKYPSFATFEDLEAYEWAFGGMFATVDSTWELYRYNAVTEQWDLVSTVEIWQYIIRVDDEPPASWTSDTIVTLVPDLHSIYVWEDAVVDNHHLDILLVWWWWGGAWCDPNGDTSWWWGGGWWVEYKQSYKVVWNSFAVKVWAWGTWGNNSSWDNGGQSSFWFLYALWWWGGGKQNTVWNAWGNWWGGGWPTTEGNTNAWWTWYATSFILGHTGWTGITESGYYYYIKWWQWASIHWEWWVTTDLNVGSTFNIWWKIVYVSEWWGGGYNWWYRGSWGSSSSSNYYCGQWTTSNAIWWGGGWAWRQRNRYNDTWMGQYTWWNGKDWVVIVAYPTDWSYWFTNATWWTVTTSTIWSKQYKVHTFTADWTFTIIS